MSKKTVVWDDDFELMLVCAERYACGRRTYMPSTVCGYIRQLLPNLSKKTLTILWNDLHGTTDQCLGDDCDVVTWRKFQCEVETELKKRDPDSWR